MAIKLDITKETEALFKSNPDVEVVITIDGADHTWVVKNSGKFLKSEFTRYCMQIRGMEDIVKAAENDSDSAKKVEESFRQAMSRFENAFKAQVHSDDGSSDAWIKEMSTQQDVLIAIVSKLIEAIGNEENPEDGD